MNRKKGGGRKKGRREGERRRKGKEIWIIEFALLLLSLLNVFPCCHFPHPNFLGAEI